jgi:acetylglutamate kinase
MSNISHINVVKIGGNVIDNPEVLSRFLDDFVKLPSPKILVHGGGKEATRLSERLQIETKMINGRRVTDRETLDVVTMVYAGLINKRIVAGLQSRGCNAIGLTGADGNVVPSHKRSPEPIDFGFVGDINPAEVNDKFIKTLLESDIVPVFCAITYDKSGTLLNSNADSVASAIATASARIADVDMHYCFEKDGVLTDIDNPDSLVAEITPDKYNTLKADGIINKGMIPKVDNAFSAVNNGVKRVIIKNSDNLLNDRGTVIRN